ncbi:SNF2 family N-terminal domain-containing protein [Zopfochytrium polystomum]|nr:SNF2 family N-terminal domain-containing protein [Zopfochytrium polystomum]
MHPELFDKIQQDQQAAAGDQWSQASAPGAKVRMLPFVPTAAGGGKPASIQIQTLDGMELGFLEHRITAVLLGILAKVYVEAFIPRVKVQPKFVSHVHLIVYGPRHHGPEIGLYLRQNGVELRAVKLSGTVPYENPHGSSSASSSRTASGDSSSEPSSHIESVYDALCSAEDLEEMEPDSHILTPLYKHQKQALFFMTERETDVDFATYNPKRSMWKLENNVYKHLITNETRETPPRQVRGGILADDMGLGKTIETISLIVTSRLRKDREERRNRSAAPPSELRESPLLSLEMSRTKTDEDIPQKGYLCASKGTLIVCPLSTVQNWEEQFAAHVTKDLLDVVVYHGPGRVQNPEALATYDIVITTYSLLSNEFSKDLKSAPSGGRSQDADGELIPLAVTSPLQQIHWERIVLDEAHIIKDSGTSQSKAACFLSASSRWCLTGTPIQNRLDDLYSLIKFIRLAPFNSKHSWNQHVSRPIRFGSDANIGVQRLQTLMKSITLRRTKQQKVDGKPILCLPERRDHVCMVELSPQERAVYTAVHDKALNLFKKMKMSGTLMKNYVHILEMILRLRQICVHPLLFKDDEAVAEWGELFFLFLPLNPRASSNYPLYLINTSPQKNSPAMLTARPSPSPQRPRPRSPAPAPSTSSTSSAKPPTTAAAPAAPSPRTAASGAGVFVSRCGHLFCPDCAAELAATAAAGEGEAKAEAATAPCPQCGVGLRAGDVIEAVEGDDNGDGREAAVEEIVRDGRGGDGVGRGGPVLSSKIRALMADLVAVRQAHLARGEQPPKCVVFSQWTSVLDLIEHPLTTSGFPHRRLDGGMNRAARASSLSAFHHDPLILVLLVSLKAGGVGLNLTAASRVYVVEPYWNPAVEQQAVDRVHRLGQQRAVETVKLVARSTIEENIVALQARKRELARLAFREGGGGGSRAASAVEEEEEEEEAVWGNAGGKGKGRGKGRDGAAIERREALRQERLLDLQLLFE